MFSNNNFKDLCSNLSVQHINKSLYILKRRENIECIPILIYFLMYL
nr:MAG TPA: hypothetical protein [Caudoviricetes sp.]DAK28846.1 MAG TPA: hypothetical protein [Caudoviricetes sp.]